MSLFLKNLEFGQQSWPDKQVPEKSHYDRKAGEYPEIKENSGFRKEMDEESQSENN